MLGLGLGVDRTAGSGGTAAAAILISGLSLAEGSAAGTTIGTLSVVNATGTPAFTLTDSAGDIVALDGSDIEAGATVSDYETATSHDFIVSVSGTTPAISARTFSLSITNVLEVTLAALTLDDSSVSVEAEVGAVVGALEGTSSGSTLTLIDDEGGKYALDGLNIEVAAALAEGSDSITVRETHADGANSPRDSIIAITVASASDLSLDFSAASNNQYLALLEDF
jgi:hypothetical protein